MNKNRERKGCSFSIVPIAVISFCAYQMIKAGMEGSSKGVVEIIEPIQVRAMETTTEMNGNDCADIYCFPGEYDSAPESLAGAAHWYGGWEQLNLYTSSGEIFDPNKMTASSWFYPLGTIINVENESNGESVEVRVNDRGPNRLLDPAENVVIDLSKAAFERIAEENESGQMNVIVTIVKKP